MKKVMDHPDFSRDSSGAVINTSQSQYESFVRAGDEKKRTESRLSSLESHVSAQTEMIKQLLTLLEKT